MNSAFQLTLHDYSASIDCGFNAPVRSDDQTVSRRVDGAFYPAIYIKVFAAREFAEVNDDIVTLFTPSSQSSSRAMANFVQCDKMHFLEVAMGGCPVQIKILERFGSAVDYGEAKSWGERHGTPTSARPRGNNVSNVNYRKDGTAAKRGIYIYAPTTGNPDYSLVTFDNLQETGVYYCGKKEVEIKPQ